MLFHYWQIEKPNLYSHLGLKSTTKMQKQITITNIEHRNALLIKKGEDE